MVLRQPSPPPAADSRCPRCNVEFNISDAPAALAVVWITCPECGIRFWKPEALARTVLEMQGFANARARWQSATILH
jgi:uncharacterized protein with PIN domain